MKTNRKFRKPQPSYSKLELEEIIGLTVSNRNALASSSVFSNDSKLVYTAGCVVVIYDVDLGTQSHLMVSNRSPKPLGCVAVSQDGSYIAAGESGHQPAIVVWSSATLAPIAELKGHRYGVACTAFSPDGKHLVSVGTPQDGNLCLWDWRSGSLFKKLKTCSPFSDVSSVSFSADASSILTAGKRHIKIWAVGLSTKSRAKNEAVSLTMHGKHVNLGQYKGCTFVDITSPFKINGNVVDEKGGDSVLVYALTSSGVLCVLHGGLTITHSVNLKVEKAYALSASQEFISCACNNGIVKLYTVCSLEYAGELPYSEDKQNNNTTNTQLATFPDAIACHFSTSEKLVVVYRDCSLYIWNIHGKFQATKCCVLVSHGGCIWDIKNLSCENMHDSSLACVARGCTGGVSFATCSADGTIRLWDMTLQSVSIERRSTLSTGQHHATTEPPSVGTFEHESAVSGVISKGYRAIAASSDGKYLAAGDSDGNLHIFDLFTSDYKRIQDSHKGEVLSLSFSLPVNDSENYYFLASGGYDKMIHLFDVKRNFDLVASIDEHLAPASSVKLTGNGRRIITCGSDKSLIFCDVAGRNDDYNISLSHQQKTCHGTINDIAIDPSTRIAVTVGQDKKINMIDIASGKVIKSFKQGGDFGDPIKVSLDASCSYVACSYSDKSICVYDFVSGEMAARAMGHGEGINGIIFLPDCKHLVSVSSDGCIFVWKVPAVFTSRMLQRIKDSSCPLSLNAIVESTSMKSLAAIAQSTSMNGNKCYEENYVRPRFTRTPMHREPKGLKETPTFKFSISRLPQWAKSKVTSPFVIPLGPISSEVVGLEEHSPLKLIDEINDPDNLALHTPSNHNDLSNSKGSTTLGSCRSFALDRRWLTIHTVCLDLSHSPEVFNTRKQMMPFTSNSSQCDALEATDNESVKHPEINISLNHMSSNSNCKLGQAGCVNVHIGLNDSGCLSHQYQSSNACVSGEEYGNENLDQLQLSAPDNQVINNSEISKIEYPSLTEQVDSELGSSYQQGMMGPNSPKNLLTKNDIASQKNSCSSSSMSLKVKTAKISGQQECEITRDEKQMSFDACKEALRNLDTSSKIALEAFSKLRDIQSKYKNSEGPDSLFCSEAAELLPSIAKNVQEIAKFANSCG
uniref:mitogen-activated protein kinase-binding protein 1 n=1 Tax=Erigeron canadensis TaxID=72917 RepID=UPI001CB88E82|nr:mitogen-activated protein kinase-binding protein 1 [Erigeron canadensis]